MSCTVREVEVIIIKKKLISMSTICTSSAVPGQISPRLHEEVWLPFSNREINYFVTRTDYRPTDIGLHLVMLPNYLW